ncbi:hypothetical protein RHSIM_RhsimUnG0115700 [Rhododendron simsii]|uniref:Uncharacterized protein n=1 Tax=Rhododendron simsii TaxID=118357 RepID=A0A834FUW7_RHOSS|nr:hypothetical protein RHSIM_RhsimUnG0115700 [Rhododendron simsii]
MEKILSGDQIHFDDLAAEEKKRFQRAAPSGELSKLIEPWEPWWLKPSARKISLSREGTQEVQPLSNEATATSTQHGASMVVSSVSSVLGEGGQPESVSEALSHCLEQTCSPAFRHMGGLRFGLVLLDDIAALVSLGGAALVCLRCDLRRLVQAAEGELKSEKKRGEIRSELNLAERKIYFIMCWVHEQPGEAWRSLVAIVNAEKGSAMEFAGNRGGALRLESGVE